MGGEHSWEDDGAKLSRPDRDSERLHEDLIESFSRLPPNTEGNDTVFYPNVQAGWSDVKIEETSLLTTLKSLKSDDTLHFCSGYLNPPESITSVLAASPAELHLLSADPRSNGFYNTKFPKSGIISTRNKLLMDKLNRE